MEIKNIKEYNADYHKDGTLAWKKIGEKTGKSGKSIRKKKNYSSVEIADIKINGAYTINEDVLQQSRDLFAETKELIPVFLSYDNSLIGGFEQYELAKELGRKRIPAQSVTRLSKSEQRKFRKAVTTSTLGNKKYPVVTKDGSRIFLSLNQYNKIQHLYKISRKNNWVLEILPDFTLCVKDKDGYIWGSPNHGLKLNTLSKKLHKPA